VRLTIPPVWIAYSSQDLLGEYADVDVWDALQRAHLEEVVRAGGGLEMRVERRGRNLTLGQRRLFSLARAVLRRGQLVVINQCEFT
jgi:ATP-binding cassette, subfamily C (CFTR/MRP), member 1